MTIDNNPSIELGIPDFMKSYVVKYRTPISSSIIIAFILGNPDTGNPIADEHINAEPYLKKYHVYRVIIDIYMYIKLTNSSPLKYNHNYHY